MESVLLLRFAGPLQSWGVGSHFNVRETGSEPTKSGVIGFLASALGRDRGADIGDLVGLSIGVRTDVAGTLLRDFHTVSDYRDDVTLPSASVNKKGKQKPSGKKTHITKRYYLQDAVFVVAVSGEGSLVRELEAALRQPAYPLFLGRRSCPVTFPLILETAAKNIADALRDEEWQASPAQRKRLYPRKKRPETIELAITVDDGHGMFQALDVPSSFDPRKRSFAARAIARGHVSIPTGWTSEIIGHDPLELLGE